ncbi:hypothetical protein GCM10009111_00120 [Colwellia asteriadis]|uniref:Uncharacterized protein n=1 Tax=Colwellia asteriadis TaxID=517723 RepID=A0ABP3WCK0_9GAMM
MNHYIKYILGFYLLLNHYTVFANDKVENNRNAVKCHVVLANSTEAISLWTIPYEDFKDLKGFENTIVGAKIYVKQSANKDKAAIDKVYQCVPEDEQFTSPQARQLDKNLYR